MENRFDHCAKFGHVLNNNASASAEERVTVCERQEPNWVKGTRK
jgi:hypothetical protein